MCVSTSPAFSSGSIPEGMHQIVSRNRSRRRQTRLRKGLGRRHRGAARAEPDGSRHGRPGAGRLLVPRPRPLVGYVAQLTESVRALMTLFEKPRLSLRLDPPSLARSRTHPGRCVEGALRQARPRRRLMRRGAAGAGERHAPGSVPLPAPGTTDLANTDVHVARPYFAVVMAAFRCPLQTVWPLRLSPGSGAASSGWRTEMCAFTCPPRGAPTSNSCSTASVSPPRWATRGVSTWIFRTGRRIAAPPLACTR